MGLYTLRRSLSIIEKVPFQLLVFVIIAGPSLTLALFVKKFGVNVVVSDDWYMVSLYSKMIAGTLTVGDLFAAYGGYQRFFFAGLALLLLERITAFNVVAEMYLGWAMLTATVGLLFYVFWVTNQVVARMRLIWYFVPASFLMFSFRQYEAILNGFAACLIYMSVLGAVAALVLLDRAKLRFYVLPVSILSALVASYSYLSGLAVWPAGFVLIGLGFQDKRDAIRRFSGWCLSCAVVVALYLHNLTNTPGGLVFVSGSLFREAESYLALIGAAFAFAPAYLVAAIGSVISIIGFLILFTTIRFRKCRTNSVLISLVAFAAFAAGTITLGRSGNGPGQVLMSRYTPMAILGSAALYLLAISISSQLKRKSSIFSVHSLQTLILLGLIVSAGAGWHIGQGYRAERLMAISVLQSYKTQPDNAIQKYLGPVPDVADPAFIRQWASYLEINRLNVFHVGNGTDASLGVSRFNSASAPGLSRLARSTFFDLLWSGRLPITQLAFATARLGLGEFRHDSTGWCERLGWPDSS